MAKVIAFDFDGVLFDSFEVYYRIESELNPHLSREMYRQWFVGNVYDEMDRNSKMYSPAEIFDRAMLVFKDWVISDDVKHVVERLARTASVVIVSSTFEYVIADILRRSGVDVFEKIYGGDLDHSKQVKLNMVLNDFGCARSDVCFITDTAGDVREAQKAQVRSIAYVGPRAFHDRSYFEGLHVERCIESLDELL